MKRRLRSGTKKRLRRLNMMWNNVRFNCNICKMNVTKFTGNTFQKCKTLRDDLDELHRRQEVELEGLRSEMMQLKHKGIQHSREFQQVRKKLDQLHKLEEEHMRFSNTFPRWCVRVVAVLSTSQLNIRLSLSFVHLHFVAILWCSADLSSEGALFMYGTDPTIGKGINTLLCWWANDPNCFPMPNCSLENGWASCSALIQNANHVQKQHGACQKVGVVAAQRDCCDGSMVPSRTAIDKCKFLFYKQKNINHVLFHAWICLHLANQFWIAFLSRLCKSEMFA